MSLIYAASTAAIDANLLIDYYRGLLWKVPIAINNLFI